MMPGDGTFDGVGQAPARNPQQAAANKRLQQTQAQVDEVVDIMRDNVQKVLERDTKLSELDNRAGEAFQLCSFLLFSCFPPASLSTMCRLPV
ncbi:Hypothetical predicted protein [Cloeon dipterum]|uniref:V-SNARE coiled-coil homology domain-containing protein n=1 Tax=Cloeon dipterum TaxID=197152 RepID=A0A8S1C9C5_9INSE|nr:Hypothetical predicted protein [Cloeon dipterum]